MHTITISQTPQHTSKTVELVGWVSTKRDHGKLTFIDLRDTSGVVQCVGYQQMGELTPESVIRVTGEVKERPQNMINPNIATGTVEISVQEYTILSKAGELAIPVDGDGKNINEEMRLRYRYLDLRRERMQHNMRLRSQYVAALRKTLTDRSFVEIETPLLTKSTKEGSRDFIVPSRFQPGKFYALPQSPQQYKQLLMTAGFERYVQFARCIRDEDLRADRGFEHTQVDLEMSFVNEQELMQTVEEMVVESIGAVGGKLQHAKFPVYTYDQAIKEFGADKFDLRTESEKQDGTLAFAWVVDFPFFKKVDTSDAAEVQDGKSGWTFTHNPFSMPKEEYLEDHLAGKNIERIVTNQYDLVCNGYEVGGGSIRAHRPEILQATFRIMGYSDKQIEANIGHMLEAFSMGTPPHGGIALGLDRLAMLLAGETSLKEVVAFPMSASGRTAVMDAPSPVHDDLLAELNLSVTTTNNPYQEIMRLLATHGASYNHLVHEPVTTSQEAADVRGTSLAQAAKALVLELDKEYVLFVLPGDMRADLDMIVKALGARKVAMASKESVLAKTGLAVGCIPPFGSVLGIKTYVHEALAQQTQIAFNVARHDRSVVMAYSDFVTIEQPTVIV